MQLDAVASRPTEDERAALDEYFPPFDHESLPPDEQAAQLAALRKHPMREWLIEEARKIRAGEVELIEAGDPFAFACEDIAEGGECSHRVPQPLLRCDDDVSDDEYEYLSEHAERLGACVDPAPSGRPGFIYWWNSEIDEREAVARVRAERAQQDGTGPTTALVASPSPSPALPGMPVGVPVPQTAENPYESPQFLALKMALFSEDEFDQRPPVDWLVHGVLPRGALGYLIGEPGNGKTFVALDLAYSLATGRDWWGHEVAKVGPVLYVAAEDDRGVQARARAWRSRFCGGQATGKVHFLTHAPQVGEPGSFDALRLLVEVLQPVLVILDTQARVTRGLDENDSKAMGELIHQANQIQRLGAAVLSVHHPARGGTVPRGSSAQEGAADVVVLCTMDDDKVLKVKNTKQKNAAEFEPLTLGLDPEGESAVLKTAQPLRWEGQEQIVAWLDELGLPQSAGYPTANKALTEAGHTITKRALEDALRLRKSRAPLPKVVGPR
ncbi:AAA family ATPase [Micromonospora chalcea]